MVSRLKRLVKDSDYIGPFASRVISTWYVIKHVIRPRRVFKPSDGCRVEIITCPGFSHVFCGYYDVTPFRHPNSRQILVHCNNLPSCGRPHVKHETAIGLYDMNNQHLRILDVTRAWNWQQGSRLQWIDSTRIVYNKYDSDIRGVLRDIDTGETEQLPCSVNICFKDRYCLTLGYDDLTRYSEYGYPGISRDSGAGMLRKCDLATGKLDDLTDYSSLRALAGAPMDGAGFHVNHLLPSPDGDRFVFIARWWLRSRRIDSLLMYRVSTRQMSSLIAGQTISHYAWINPPRLLFWGCLDGRLGYYLVNSDSHELDYLFESRDGHPSAINGEMLLTDVVDDWRIGDITLSLVSLRSGMRRDLLIVSHPKVFMKTNRCDMHASISQEGRYFQIDSRHQGSRCVVVGTLPWL